MKKEMQRRKWTGIALLMTAALFFTATVVRAESSYGYIDISNPFLRKIPIAIPAFLPVSAVADEEKSAAISRDLLSESLEFTGYFSIIDPVAYLEDPRKTGITADHLTFKNWTAIGAELVVTGGVLLSGDVLEMELRLFDPFKEKLLIGKRYKGVPKDYRRMVRRFCSEVIYLLTGDWGIFDSRIAFVSNGTGHKEIWLCDFDGYNPVRWTSHESICLSPAWSSDGQWIAYTSYSRGKPDLYIRHKDEKRGVVVDHEGINTSPAWVPGQFALAATLSFSGDPEIYLLTGDGKIIKRITKNWGIDESPTWSPDARKIAFVSNRAGSPQIYIQAVDSDDAVRLTYDGNYNTQPAWSPKGDKIAYTAMEGGQTNIRVIDVKGGSAMQLTRDSGENERASWSPDGSMLVFSSSREGRTKLYVMTAFGTDQRRLLSLPGEQGSPAWSSRNPSN